LGDKKKAGDKKVHLELGGNASVIIDKTANIDLATSRLTWGAFYLAGQSCISVQKIFVHDEIYNKFVEMFIKKTELLKVGDPYDEKTEVGPLIDVENAKRIQNWIKEAVDHGAKIICGPKITENLMTPTILENVPSNVKLCKEEVFGPVCYIERFSDFKEVCNKINTSPYGLQAGVFSQSLENVFYAFDNLEVGGVIINDVSATRIEPLPYGGVKKSGLGREGIRFAMDEMTELKVMIMRNMDK